ncbi:hypothetical protein BE21_54940 [Sorangium cellulosum]|uniref:Peptidase S1 domain-containing protein n=1 Tax=Sorangium cellulosum TaxID=56 RepID=A0A150TCN6_SORCE|nr:hypothetical protein BE21_54940 [Sorangium cellulosum]
MKWMLFGAAGALAVSGCVVDQAEGEGDPGEAEEAIINGFDLFTPESIGVVKVMSSPGLSSGTLIRNQWVLTSAHGVGTAASTTVELPSPVNPQTKTVAQVIKHPTLDVALLKLSSPLAMPAGLFQPWSTTGYQKTISSRTTNAMSGLAVNCAGYGRNTFTSGSGQLRWASFSVGPESSTFFIVQNNSLSQVPWHGDSGGPCYPTADPFATEVLSVAKECVFGVPPGGTGNVHYCRYTSAQAFRSWVLSNI